MKEGANKPMATLELLIMAGAESKALLEAFTKQLDRMEALTAQKSAPAVIDEDKALVRKKPAATKAAQSFEDDEEEIIEEDEDKAEDVEFEDDMPVSKPKTKAKSFDDDEDEDPAPVKSKKTKAPKITLDDVNDACQERALRTGGKKGREEVLSILKKQFKTTSVSGLKPEQYGPVIEALQA